MWGFLTGARVSDTPSISDTPPSTEATVATPPAIPKRGRNDPPPNFEPYQTRSRSSNTIAMEAPEDDQDALFAMFAGQVSLRELALSSITDEPKSHKEAMNGPDREQS